MRAVGADGRGRLAQSADSVSLSPSGRFVAYCSTDELVAPDSSDYDDNTPNTDVFVRDLRSGRVRRASTAVGGGEADDYSCFPDVADTGDVGFFSRATNLVSGDVNGVPDYFLYDWGSRKVRRLATAEIASGSVRISGDGSAAAVVTTEVLAGRDSGTLPDVYVLSRGRGLRGTWSMPLTQDGGLPTDTGCGWVGLSISGTGRYVTGACADGGVAASPIADKPVHLWWTDRRSGDVRLVNRTEDGDSEVDDAQVSDDGRRVFFASEERGYTRTVRRHASGELPGGLRVGARRRGPVAHARRRLVGRLRLRRLRRRAYGRLRVLQRRDGCSAAGARRRRAPALQPPDRALSTSPPF